MEGGELPRPVEANTAYIPGLDGLRALAVLAVIGYHLHVPGMSGGLLGVAVFFTLSGFLITGLLLAEQIRTGSVRLGRFWLRRARRLLPAVVVVLAAVLLATALVSPSTLGDRWRESLAAIAYVANWATIFGASSYFDRFAGPGPLDHLWSLSVEEQFYLVWPLLLLLMLKRFRWSPTRVAVVTAALAAISFWLMAWMAEPGFDNTRAYEGSDTRAGGLLVGAVLALLWPKIRGLTVRWPRLVVVTDLLGLVGLAGVGALIVLSNDYSLDLYRGRILLLSIATSLVLLAVCQPRSLLNRILGFSVLRWIGERSYGIYLWHLPLIVFLGGASAEFEPIRSVLLVALTLLVAELSWQAVEDPIRRHGFRAAARHTWDWLRDHVRAKARGPASAAAATHLVLAGTLVLALGAVVARVGHEAGPAVSSLAGGPVIVETGPDDVAPDPTAPDPTAPDQTGSPSPTPGKAAGGGETRAPRDEAQQPASTGGPLRTSCTQVVHVGDSTSLGLVLASYQPDRSARLPAQLHRVGVEESRMDVSGARSIVETYHGEPNASEAVASVMQDGYSGCWSIAMGTNEAANQAVGGVYPFDDRIDRIMKEVDGDPVLWLTVRTRLSSGPYRDSGMAAFSKSLIDACERYPNLRVYDWRAEVNDSWYVDDGIHFTPEGYRQRARGIADALAIAFPKDGSPSPGCLVRTDKG
jgi:peptidoglycan/LPS O-acetylase OafA/YrhL